MSDEIKRTANKRWPINMTQAAHIARLPVYAGTDLAIAMEYGVDESLVRRIRTTKGFNGVNLA